LIPSSNPPLYLRLHRQTGPGEAQLLRVGTDPPVLLPRQYCFIRLGNEKKLYLNIDDLIREIGITRFEVKEHLNQNDGNTTELLRRHERLIGLCRKLGKEKSGHGAFAKNRLREKLIDYILRHKNGRLFPEKAEKRIEKLQKENNLLAGLAHSDVFLGLNRITDFKGDEFKIGERLEKGSFLAAHALRKSVGARFFKKTDRAALITADDYDAVNQFKTNQYVLARLRQLQIPHIPPKYFFSVYSSKEEKIVAIAKRRAKDALAALYDLTDNRAPELMQNFVLLLREVCEALIPLHGAGYIYGDLKLENILVDKDLSHTTLIDFGCFGIKGENPQFGTHIPPEIREDRYMLRVLDESFDMFAVGVMTDIFLRVFINQHSSRWISEDILKKSPANRNSFIENHLESIRQSLFNRELSEHDKKHADLLLSLEKDLLSPEPKNRPSAQQVLNRINGKESGADSFQDPRKSLSASASAQR